MLLGFSIGAIIAVATAFALAAEAGRFSYAGMVKILFSLGALGAYLGHAIGAARNKEAGFKPFGPLTQEVLTVGAVIVVVGSAAVMGAVLGIMTLIYGPSPH